MANKSGSAGAKFRLSDYQIVNGCQTSHVLHLNREIVGDSIFVPVKLIETGDPEITNQVIKATNRQTQVTLEAFEPLNPFHRKLEDFYNSFSKDVQKALYYERRSKQYADTAVKPILVISLAAQTKSYLAMFLGQPHSTHRYYGELLDTNRERLFVEGHSPFLYYSAGLALNRVDRLFRHYALIDVEKRFKHHLLLLFRLSVCGPAPVPFNGKKADDSAKEMCTVLWDPQRTLDTFLKCGEQLRSSLATFSGDRGQAYRRRDFMEHLVPSHVNRPRGIVKYWNLDHGYGFVKLDEDEDVFVHC